MLLLFARAFPGFVGVSKAFPALPLVYLGMCTGIVSVFGFPGLRKTLQNLAQTIGASRNPEPGNKPPEG